MARTSVLLVEDFTPDARLIEELLKDADGGADYQLSHVRSLGAAEAALKAENFDCVLLDLGLPDSNGVENVERIAKLGQDLAIVVMTGLDDERAALEALQRGAQEYLVKGKADGNQLVRVMRHAVERSRLVAELNQLRERDYFHATHDLLTGLPNRQLLNDRVQQAISYGERHGSRFALCFLDLDGFKAVNDLHGHAAGDALLKKVSDLVRNSVRDGDTAARVGGDEFVLLLSPIRGRDETDPIVNRLVAGVGSLASVAGKAVDIGASAGIAFFPDDGRSQEELSNVADRRMYQTKRERKANRLLQNQQPAKRVEDVLSWELEFRPIVQLPENSCWGLEAQARLAPSGKAQAGRVSGLELMSRALPEFANWRATGGPQRLAVNVSSSELMRPGYTQRVLRLLSENEVSPQQLQLELPEEDCDADPDLLINLSTLRAQGVSVVVDHFGRDDASMSRVSRFPIDGLKLDPGLVHGLRDDSRRGRAIVQSVLRFAEALEISVTLDGIDTEADLQAALNEKSRYVQGAHVGAALNTARVAELYCSPLPSASSDSPLRH